jgi:hypothetical protein
VTNSLVKKKKERVTQVFQQVWVNETGLEH